MESLRKKIGRKEGSVGLPGGRGKQIITTTKKVKAENKKNKVMTILNKRNNLKINKKKIMKILTRNSIRM